MDTQTMTACAHPSATHCPYRHETGEKTLCAKFDDACPASLADTMKHRNLGDFWKVQQQLAQTLQLDIARTLKAKRLHGEPTDAVELHELAHAMQRCAECYDVAQWRLNGNERADE